MSDVDEKAFGAAVLVGNQNWKTKPKWICAFAWLFGKRQTFEHLGKKGVISWWGGEPFLISFDQAE